MKADVERPVIVAVVPWGTEATRVDRPDLPRAPAEIAAAALAAHEAGAAIAHVHVREPDGTPSARPELFEEVLESIDAGSDMVTMASTGGSAGMSVEDRLAGLAAGPDMVSVETGSFNFGEELFATLPGQSQAIAGRALAAGIGIQVEGFEVGHVEAALEMIDAEALPVESHFAFVLGVPGGIGASIQNLIALRSALPDRHTWGATVLGRHQRRLLAVAIALGADVVRVGFEHNVHLRSRQPAPSSAELVADVAHLVEELGRRVATVAEARERLAL